ncbi:hypothetical protein CJ030_MR3G019060 [Morella rubra]|uniref:Uncharacterized protein n=1 Tax=Morella rubra TaxID=262757 RepID=A0A6A1W4Y9_9ROSI|nr:hypothetical protein CJ030_MR3G019060 [Morella rubra]
MLRKHYFEWNLRCPASVTISCSAEDTQQPQFTPLTSAPVVSPSTLTMTPTMQSKSKTYNLRPRSKMGKDSDWTANQELMLLNILKDKTVDEKKGLPTYELMCGLFSTPISKRKYHHVSTTNLLDTDHEREVEDGLIRLGIDDSHDPSNTGAPSTAQSPSTPHTSLDKRGIDLISNIHHHSKRMKGKSVANTNSTVLFKFVNAQNRHNDILEQWMAMKNAHNVFLRRSKELENVFAQKAFSIITDARLKAWLYSL